MGLVEEKISVLESGYAEEKAVGGVLENIIVLEEELVGGEEDVELGLLRIAKIELPVPDNLT